MADLFNNTYRIPSSRLQLWDYANEGMYFVTICTKNMECYLGKIIETQGIASLQPTEIGKIAETEWSKTIKLRTDMNLTLGEFVVMPNHVHGIIMIGENEYNAQRNPQSKNQFAPQSKNLASIIRGYKSAVTSYARKNSIEFEWQSRFHEHIIRSMDSYTKIANYIINNSAKWQSDKFFR